MRTRKVDNYNPQGKTRAALERAWELVQSVPYQVSARWLFYRLLQEGYYSGKSDYKDRFLPAVSEARRRNFQQWRPDTLADETRQAIRRGIGFDDPRDYLDALAEQLVCRLDRWHGQPYYVELWFEARAMSDQFAHYTEHLTLRPMGGQPSIPYKYEAAKAIEAAAVRYGAPVVILYFGDLDPAGETIGEVIERDVRLWCNADFTFTRCGLTAEQVQIYAVPENPEHPGSYQWEALSDGAAQAIITAGVAPYLDPDGFDEIDSLEQQATTWIRAECAKLAELYRPQGE